MGLQFKKKLFSSLFVFFALMFITSQSAEAIFIGGINVTKTHEGNFTVDQEGTFVFTVSAAYLSGETVGDITITDVLPSGFSFVGVSGSGWTASVVDSTVTLAYSGILADSEAITVYLTVKPSIAGTYTNSVTANGILVMVESPVEAYGTDTVIVSNQSILSVSMTHKKKRFVLEREETFKISVGNIGSDDTNESITLISTLPANLNLKEVIGEGWSVYQDGQTVIMKYLLTLSAGEFAPVVKLKIKPKATGIYTNSVVVTLGNVINVASDTVKVINN